MGYNGNAILSVSSCDMIWTLWITLSHSYWSVLHEHLSLFHSFAAPPYPHLTLIPWIILPRLYIFLMRAGIDVKGNKGACMCDGWEFEHRISLSQTKSDITTTRCSSSLSEVLFLSKRACGLGIRRSGSGRDVFYVQFLGSAMVIESASLGLRKFSYMNTSFCPW